VRILKLPEAGAQDQTLAVGAVQRWLSTHDSWLLILDNVDNLTMTREFIPPGNNGPCITNDSGACDRCSGSTPCASRKGRQPVLDNQKKLIKDVVRLERPKVITAAVFNAEQIDGIPSLEPERTYDWDPVEQAEKLLQASGAKIEHSQSGGAYYDFSRDTIRLPSQDRFTTPSAYYATALHELGHWTAHPDRLDRDLRNPFGSEGYAREELRAEIASLILGSELGIGYDPDSHAGYVDH
jgi:antirestriction protein ArdC